MRFPPTHGDAFDVHVAVRDIEPAIWRRLRVPAHLTLGELHEVLQIALGWTNSHLHDFDVGEIRFGMPDLDDELFSVDENAAPLGAVAKVGSVFTYRYDFGDDWEHDVKVEQHLERPEEMTVTCLAGARACPPEDCGGVRGYERLLQVLANPDDDEHHEMRTWVGRRFNPEAFDLAAVNKKLARWKRPKMRKARAVRASL